MSLIKKLGLKLLGVNSIEELLFKEYGNSISVDLLMHYVSNVFTFSEFSKLIKTHLEADELLKIAAQMKNFRDFEHFMRNEDNLKTNREFIDTITLRLIEDRKDSSGDYYSNSEIRDKLVEQAEFIETGPEKNILKKKSLLVKEIKKFLPGLSKSETNLMVELLVQLIK